MSIQTLTVGYGSAKKSLTEFYLVKAEIKFAINNIPFAELRLEAERENIGAFNDQEKSEVDLLKPGSDIKIERDGKLLLSGVVTERIYNLMKNEKKHHSQSTP
ncbi:hypothetical protein SME10J_23830 [Serratia marcescens]|nr:hypothetical protein SME10J_23830 [Serratia marcescens]